MTVVVAYKYASNPQDATVAADGKVDWTRAKPSVSEYDSVAIELGRNVADAAGAELVGVSVGPSTVSSSMAKKAAMSKGFDRGIVAADDSTADWNITKVASALADLIGKVDGVDLVLTGDASLDNGARLTSALLGGFLGWPVFQEVRSIQKTADGYKLTQRAGNGTREIDVNGPVVASAGSDAVTPRVPSMKEILAAGKKQVDVVDVAELKTVDASVETTGTARPEAKARKNQIFKGDSAIADLAVALRNDAVL